MSEVDLELRGTVAQSRAIVDDGGVGALAKGNQIVASAVISIAMGLELQSLENAMQFGQMIGIFWTDQQVHVHEPGLSGNVEP